MSGNFRQDRRETDPEAPRGLGGTDLAQQFGRRCEAATSLRGHPGGLEPKDAPLGGRQRNERRQRKLFFHELRLSQQTGRVHLIVAWRHNRCGRRCRCRSRCRKTRRIMARIPETCPFGAHRGEGCRRSPERKARHRRGKGLLRQCILRAMFERNTGVDGATCRPRRNQKSSP
jgi:hypothetical protein